MDPKKAAEIKAHVDGVITELNVFAMHQYAKFLRKMQVRNISIHALYFFP